MVVLKIVAFTFAFISGGMIGGAVLVWLLKKAIAYAIGKSLNW